jgi:hypothetical protein
MPNFTVERLALLLGIQKVPRSDLGAETSYPLWSSGFSQSLWTDLGIRNYFELGHALFLPYPFQIII